MNFNDGYAWIEEITRDLGRINRAPAAQRMAMAPLDAEQIFEAVEWAAARPNGKLAAEFHKALMLFLPRAEKNILNYIAMSLPMLPETAQFAYTYQLLKSDKVDADILQKIFDFTYECTSTKQGSIISEASLKAKKMGLSEKEIAGLQLRYAKSVQCFSAALSQLSQQL